MAHPRLVALLVCAAVQAPALVLAQAYPAKPPPVPAVVVVPPERPRAGFSVSVGGGVSHLSQGFFGDITQLGLQGEARILFGTRSPISFEAGYVGTARAFDTISPEEAILISNGLEAVMRLNFGAGDVQPHLFGGVGWAMFKTIHPHKVTIPDLTDGDAVLSCPVGGGITGFFHTGFLIDVRFAYRFAFEEDVLNRGIQEGRTAGLDSWSTTVQLGYEF